MQQSYCKIVSAIINTTFVSLYCSVLYGMSLQEGEKRKVHDLAKENREEDFMDIEVR